MMQFTITQIYVSVRLKQMINKLLCFKESFSYDKETGLIRWLISPSASVKIGDIAGNITNNGRGKSYVKIDFNGKHYYAHRLAWLLINGTWPENEIDHIDGDGTNNKWINLRAASRIDNMRNRRIPSHNKSGVIGVHWNKEINKWVAQITHNKKQFTIGYFSSIDDAALARKNAEIKLGYHKNHGISRSL